MKANRKILISGASIAGPVLAYWLHRYGFEVVVVERAPELRLGGQNIDVKGPAWEIIRKMGLEEKIRAANTTEIGLRFVNEKNETLAEFPKESALSMTQELEILRGDLVRILYDATKDKAEYRFGDHITEIKEDDGGVSISFDSGASEEFDLLLIAEGIGSHTRSLVFGDEPRFVYLGLYTSYFTIDRADSDSRWARWHNAPGGIVYLLRPDNYGKTRVCINLRSAEKGYEKLSPAEQKNVLLQAINGTGWESERIKEALKKTGDLYLERLSQVQAPRWSKGRVAMTGDAAYCVTPIGGKGTDLAITGAYILAGELHKNSNFVNAFEAYENRLRPFVTKTQKRPPGVPSLIYPTSKPGVGVLNTFFRLAGSRPVKFLAKKLGGSKRKPKKEIELPDYDN